MMSTTPFTRRSAKFTTTGIDILWLAIQGKTPFDMAANLCMSVTEIRAAVSGIIAKTGVTGLRRYAVSIAQSGELWSY
jgi:DNA-binding CsgD family transcriptional regulator